MKYLIYILFLSTNICVNNVLAIDAVKQPKLQILIQKKITIKIKNDQNTELHLINTSGTIIHLPKDKTTSITLAEGENLYEYKDKKRGKLLFTAQENMVGKVLLYSKL